MTWRDTMAQVLQGVMQTPQIPPNFQTPQSGAPMPPLGRFGMEAFNMAGLPASIPKRVVSPAELVRGPPGGVPQIAPTGSHDVLPPLSEINIPPGSLTPRTEQPVDYSDPNQIPPFQYVPDAPYTYTSPDGQTITEHSDILNPGTTVGDLIGGGVNNGGQTFVDYLTNPFGSMVDAIGGMAGQWGNQWADVPLHLVDPPMFDPTTPWYDPAHPEYNVRNG